MKKTKKEVVETTKTPIDSGNLPANSFTSLYSGWIGFFSATFRHLGDKLHCMITADIKEGKLYLVLILQLSQTCSIEVSKIMATSAGRFQCTATRVRLQREEKTVKRKKEKTIVLVPTASTEDKEYYVEFFKGYI